MNKRDILNGLVSTATVPRQKAAAALASASTSATIGLTGQILGGFIWNCRGETIGATVQTTTQTATIDPAQLAHLPPALSCKLLAFDLPPGCDNLQNDVIE